MYLVNYWNAILKSYAVYSNILNNAGKVKCFLGQLDVAWVSVASAPNGSG